MKRIKYNWNNNGNNAIDTCVNKFIHSPYTNINIHIFALQIEQPNIYNNYTMIRYTYTNETIFLKVQICDTLRPYVILNLDMTPIYTWNTIFDLYTWYVLVVSLHLIILTTITGWKWDYIITIYISTCI